ncbi:MAG TPA: pilus assembly protein TadG-related protein [Candidatus Sulfomarinibacteraceae bacterium]|nr:pilus assembly protein TadG-related protein [Candidatus Sulfomarinibacteraceae bacterium]
MSSTTERRHAERGQILVVFAGGLVAICAVAALVFDVGQNLLDRRAEQNASDAAALAGARYVVGAAYTFHGGCSTPHSGLPAIEAACDVAAKHGYVDGQDGRTVRVDMPPVAPSRKAGLPEHIEVTIGATRTSFFMGILGWPQQQTGAMGVATNQSDIALPYSLLALNPHDCGANKITGAPGTVVETNGTVHIDSDCATNPGAIQLAGNGVLTAPQCDVVGLIVESGGATNNCTTAPAGVLVSGDPLRDLAPPPQPAAPLAVQPLDVLDPGPIPAACPGGASPATDAAPATCAFSAGSMAGKTYRIFPGNYPGGISTSKAILFLEPGVYWLGGSGLQIQSDGAVVSKAPGDNTGLAPSGGVLIYNTVDPLPSSGCTGAGCYGPISINGGGGTPTLALEPIENGLYTGMVIFVDRDAAGGGGFDIDLNGENSVLNVTGTIYAPTASVRFNGSETDVLSAQLICYDFVVNGSGAAFSINYDPANLFHVKGVGLVE